MRKRAGQTVDLLDGLWAAPSAHQWVQKTVVNLDTTLADQMEPVMAWRKVDKKAFQMGMLSAGQTGS